MKNKLRFLLLLSITDFAFRILQNVDRDNKSTKGLSRKLQLLRDAFTLQSDAKHELFLKKKNTSPFDDQKTYFVRFEFGNRMLYIAYKISVKIIFQDVRSVTTI